MPAYEKTIVCLANSRKISGRCIAGKEYNDGQFGGWIRPISDRRDEEISEEDRRYENGEYANLLHVVTIPMHRPAPDGAQTENHLIDADYYWEKHGSLEWDALYAAVDKHPLLWINGHSSNSGVNDRVPEHLAATIRSSLALIGPISLTLQVSAEGADYGNDKRRVRAFFRHNRIQYGIAVTDPYIERTYLRRGDGQYRVDDAFLCISLGKTWKGFAYKLAASIITPDRAP